MCCIHMYVVVHGLFSMVMYDEVLNTTFKIVLHYS